MSWIVMAMKTCFGITVRFDNMIMWVLIQFKQNNLAFTRLAEIGHINPFPPISTIWSHHFVRS